MVGRSGLSWCAFSGRLPWTLISEVSTLGHHGVSGSNVICNFMPCSGMSIGIGLGADGSLVIFITEPGFLVTNQKPQETGRWPPGEKTSPVRAFKGYLDHTKETLEIQYGPLTPQATYWYYNGTYVSPHGLWNWFKIYMVIYGWCMYDNNKIRWPSHQRFTIRLYIIPSLSGPVHSYAISTPRGAYMRSSLSANYIVSLQ